jgi:hypothetical protein
VTLFRCFARCERADPAPLIDLDDPAVLETAGVFGMRVTA